LQSIERRERNPKNTQQPNVFLHPVGARIGQVYAFFHLSPTLAAEFLTRL
jgi:hypothetical protein